MQQITNPAIPRFSLGNFLHHLSKKKTIHPTRSLPTPTMQRPPAWHGAHRFLFIKRARARAAISRCSSRSYRADKDIIVTNIAFSLAGSRVCFRANCDARILIKGERERGGSDMRGRTRSKHALSAIIARKRESLFCLWSRAHICVDSFRLWVIFFADTDVMGYVRIK